MTYLVHSEFHPRTAALLLLLCCLAGCRNDASAARGRTEQPVNVAAVQPHPAPAPAEPVRLAAPTLEDVNGALKRVFGDDVKASGSFNPVFMTGDFNGDGIEDLAVIVRPAVSKLSEVNDELANWTLQDADRYFVPPAGKAAVVPPQIERPKILDEDVLAIIHGYGPAGWRNPEARQTYLVRHAAAAFTGTAPAAGIKSIRALRLPVRTQVLKGQRNGKPGYLFWTSSAYAWKAAR